MQNLIINIQFSMDKVYKLIVRTFLDHFYELEIINIRKNNLNISFDKKTQSEMKKHSFIL